MKMLPTLAAVVVVALTSSPAFALFCVDEGPSAGLTFEFGLNGKLRSNPDLQKEQDLMRLRQAGVDATSVERWNGCMRAFVRQPDGRITMEFYNPRTLVRMQ